MPKMPFGKYKNINLAFINSGYLTWLIGEHWFSGKINENLVVAIQKELAERERGRSHFYEDKVNV